MVGYIIQVKTKWLFCALTLYFRRLTTNDDKDHKASTIEKNKTDYHNWKRTGMKNSSIAW